MNPVISSLNPAQKEAVECLSGPILILAGAGSGKTKTLTHRIANLLAHGVPEHRILAVTFTNKAANEMRVRLWNILHSADDEADPVANPAAIQAAPHSFMPFMGTFHSIAVRILREEFFAARLPRDFVIYDTDDQLSLIRRILKNLQITSKNLKPKLIQNIISDEKNKGNGPDEYAATAKYPDQRAIARIFKIYEDEKTRAGALDFDDLLLRTLRLFKTDQSVCARWRDHFDHILIDEYQDTNAIQYQLVKLLVNQNRNLCVVGDDWQSIYSWRGADFTNILNFERDFPGAKVVKLEQNYRSTARILEASQKIIYHNHTRTDKALFTEAGDGAPIEIKSVSNETSEAEFVAMTIAKLKPDFPSYSDFAVLYRTNAQSYAFEKTFIDFGVPYKIVGGVRFYDRKEVKDVLAILKLIVAGRDKVSFERVAKNVLSGFGDVSLNRTLSAIDSIKSDAPLLNPDLPEILSSSRARSSLEHLAHFLFTTKPDENAGEVVRRAVEYFDFKTLTDDGSPSSEERMQNLEVLAENATAAENLENFLADAALMSSADETINQNSVTLMTMHAAKGLEFPVVFIVGLEEGLFPTSSSNSDPDRLEEERRLMYVGMTRAMDRLYLTHAESRNRFGSRSYAMPSRFLTELGYNPYGSGGYEVTDSADSTDIAPASDFSDFTDDDFPDENFDPFPPDLPVYT